MANSFNKASRRRKLLEAKAERKQASHLAGFERETDVPLPDEDRIKPPIIDPMLTWLAISLRPGTYRRVLAAMKRAKIVTYCPVETRWAQRARSAIREEVQRPLFGSLIFIGTDWHTPWVSIRFNDDISGVLSNHGLPLPIPAAVLEKLAERETRGEFATPRCAPPITPDSIVLPSVGQSGVVVGDVAVLDGGFFSGSEVDVVGLAGDDAKVVLKHFRSATIMRVPVSVLRPAEEPKGVQ